MEEQQDESSPISINKDEILSHFQEITDFYDIEQSQAILESTNWNLDQAIQSFFNNGEIMITETSQPSQPLPITSATTQTTIINESENHLDLFANGTSIMLNQTTTTTTSKSKRLLTFNIEFYTNKFQLYVPDNNTVLDLKNLITQEIQLPAKYQKLKGWKNKDATVLDNMELNYLNLPLETNLYVINTDPNFNTDKAATSSSSSSLNNNNNNLFELNITFINNLNKPYRLQFESKSKFIDLKSKISKLIDLSTNEQEWWFAKLLNTNNNNNNMDNTSLDVLIENGTVLNLPLNLMIKNDSNLNEIKTFYETLSESNMKTGVSSGSGSIKFTSAAAAATTNDSKLTPLNQSDQIYKLSFLVTAKSATNKTKSNQIVPSTSTTITNSNDNDDIDTDDFEYIESNELNNNKRSKQLEKDENDEIDEEDLIDTDDNFVLDTSSSSSKQKSLIPATCPVGDEFLGTTLFVEEFFKRYQPIIPLFYIGTLENAIKEALLCPARNRKLLGIYLHNDKSICRHIFCAKTLCDENVVNFLISNFIVWAWDITNSEHETHFYTSCSKYLGSVVANHLKTNKITYPAFLIVNRMRGTNEVIAVIEGDASHEVMMQRLMQSYEMFEVQRYKDEKDEQTRDERERIKREQDAAYQQSLEMDKAKRQKQTEDLERIKQTAQLEEELMKQKEKEKELFIQKCLTNLNEEPNEKVASNQITRIRFRLPDGQMLERKFLITNKLEQIIYFINGNGYFNDEYKLLSSWPRRDLTSTEQSKEQTIEELKLFPQETLTVERR